MRVRKIVRRGVRLTYITLRRLWNNYLHPQPKFTPSLDLTRRPRPNIAGTISHCQFSDLDSFLSSPVRVGLTSVWHAGLPIDFSLATMKNAPLTVVFHGAADPEVRLPLLSGVGVTLDLDTSRLSFSDPSLLLHEDLNLAWFNGSHLQPDLFRVLADIVRKVALSVGASKIVFLGGSGGGYASLRMLEHFPHGTAIAMNPQTDIDRYHAMHVKKYVDLAWNGERNILDSVAGTTVFDGLEKVKDTATVLYLQNSNDAFHVKQHFLPFQKQFSGAAGFHVLQDAWRDGHTPPPKDLIQEVLAAALAEDDPALLEKLGFQSL